MKIEELKKMYNLSQDYALLESLLYEGKEIPCFVTYDCNYDPDDPIMVTDIAVAKYRKGRSPESDIIMVGCRGSGFIDSYPNDEWEAEFHPFIKQCKRFDLWFIVPNK